MILNQLSFALSEDAVYWIKEGIGILASVFVLVSFLFSNECKTRIINIIGAAVFVVYGIILPAYATSIMNGALIIVHVVKLSKDYAARRKKAQDETLPQPAETEQSEDSSKVLQDKSLDGDEHKE